MKEKNPLYVVKSDHVEQAENYGDYFIKKLGLEPIFLLFKDFLLMLLDFVKSYATLEFVLKLLESWQKRFQSLYQRSVSGIF